MKSEGDWTGQVKGILRAEMTRRTHSSGVDASPTTAASRESFVLTALISSGGMPYTFATSRNAPRTPSIF